MTSDRVPYQNSDGVLDVRSYTPQSAPSFVESIVTNPPMVVEAERKHAEAQQRGRDFIAAEDRRQAERAAEKRIVDADWDKRYSYHSTHPGQGQATLGFMQRARGFLSGLFG
jgi:hypothetical protein